MKKTLFFAVAATAMLSALTSCSEVDNPATPKSTVITFENQQLNADGFWIGSAEGNSYSYSDDWGGTTTTYTDNVYTEAGVRFPVSYSVYASSYGTSDFWSGFAISSRTETSFAALTITPDQYNNVVGTAHSGSNFMIIQTYGEQITLDVPVTVSGFYYTNSAYTVNSILNGDNYSGAKFDETDWFKCTITGTHADGTKAEVALDLAKDGDYVKDWQWADLTELGEVVSLGFTFSGSRSNDYGVLTPAYICIDDVKVAR
ncbi:MAG: DUF4465 domain-containing protein [Prevotella sp.]|nr:DUF4465 domain-containing protein [Prevotella sp.]